MSERIAAIVVTYNRLADLKICVDSLRNQTRRPDLILAVNNGSSDGTEDWLRAQPDVEFVSQQNGGSSGGQYTGIRVAFEKGFDWMWCMDDDGIPAPTALEGLLKAAHTHGLGMVGPLVVERDADYMVFDHGKTLAAAKAEAVNGLIDAPISFNGVLFSADAVRRAGNVKKEMFIWGDDVEFYWRVRRAGFKAAITVMAEHRHPADRLRSTKFPALKLSFKWIANEQRRLIYYRNMVFLSRTYGDAQEVYWNNPARLCKDIALTSAYIVFFNRLNLASLWRLLRYCWDGFTNQYCLPPSKDFLESMLLK